MPGQGPGMGFPISELSRSITGNLNAIDPRLGSVANSTLATLIPGFGNITNAGADNLGGQGINFDRFNGKFIPENQMSELGRKIKNENVIHVRGGQNSGGRCAGLNTPPPEEIYNNINYTIEMLVKYCPSASRLIQPGTITSAYRSPNYNFCITGPNGTGYNGPHTSFIALDIPFSSISLSEIRGAVQQMYRDGITWGYGEYASFFHIDCRGYFAAWPNSNPMNGLGGVR